MRAPNFPTLKQKNVSESSAHIHHHTHDCSSIYDRNTVSRIMRTCMALCDRVLGQERRESRLRSDQQTTMQNKM